MEELKRTRRKYSRQEIADILLRFQASGKKPQEFCLGEGIHPSTLRNWVLGRGGGKKDKTSRSSAFVSLELPGHRPLMEINFAGGMRISFYAEPRIEFLKSLLA